MSNTLTRRTAITAALATAAAPAAAAIPGPVEPDPVYAAIEAHRAAYAKYADSCDALQIAEESTPVYVVGAQALEPWTR